MLFLQRPQAQSYMKQHYALNSASRKMHVCACVCALVVVLRWNLNVNCCTPQPPTNKYTRSQSDRTETRGTHCQTQQYITSGTVWGKPCALLTCTRPVCPPRTVPGRCRSVPSGCCRLAWLVGWLAGGVGFW